jgi:hypothetical protein
MDNQKIGNPYLKLCTCKNCGFLFVQVQPGDSRGIGARRGFIGGLRAGRKNECEYQRRGQNSQSHKSFLHVLLLNFAGTPASFAIANPYRVPFLYIQGEKRPCVLTEARNRLARRRVLLCNYRTPPIPDGFLYVFLPKHITSQREYRLFFFSTII